MCWYCAALGHLPMWDPGTSLFELLNGTSPFEHLIVIYVSILMCKRHFLVKTRIINIFFEQDN